MSTPSSTPLTGVRTWVDGAERPISASDWAIHLLTSLGCAYRVEVPAGRTDDTSWWWARDRAREVATRFGATFDETPWTAPGDLHLGWEVHGVWQHRFRAPLGTATTRVTPLAAPTETRRTSRAVALPFPYGSRSPLAGLPVPQPELESAAARHLGDEGADVGLWVDHDGELCTSTAGPLVVRTPQGTWRHPRSAAAAVPTWAWEQFIATRGSRPARLELAALTVPGTTAYAVAGNGVIAQLTLRGQPTDTGVSFDGGGA